MNETSTLPCRTRRSWLQASLAALLVGFTGRSAQAAHLSGHWRGNWYSCTTGHKGPLRATFCELGNGDYQVNFRGRFFRIFPFRYSVVLNVVGYQDGMLLLAGQSDLGRLFGTFHYTATASDCEFRADYTSCKDRGRFWLEKCG